MRVVLRIAEPARNLRSISAIKALHRQGMPLKQAKDALEHLVELYWSSQDWDDANGLKAEVTVRLHDEGIFDAYDELKQAGLDPVICGD